MEQFIWHYAVWKGLFSYMQPACIDRQHLHELLALKDRGDTYLHTHGISINRGDVNCPDCKRMMGMV